MYRSKRILGVVVEIVKAVVFRQLRDDNDGSHRKRDGDERYCLFANCYGLMESITVILAQFRLWETENPLSAERSVSATAETERL